MAKFPFLQPFIFLLVIALPFSYAQTWIDSTYSSLQLLTDPTDLTVLRCAFQGGLLLQNGGIPKKRTIRIQFSSFNPSNMRFLNMSFAPGSLVEITYNTFSTAMQGVYLTDGGYEDVMFIFAHNIATVTSSYHVLAFKQEGSIATNADNLTLVMENNTVSTATNNCNTFWIKLASLTNSNITFDRNAVTFNSNTAAGALVIQTNAVATFITARHNTLSGQTSSSLAALMWYQILTECQVVIENNKLMQRSPETATGLYSNTGSATTSSSFTISHNEFAFAAQTSYTLYHQGEMKNCSLTATNNSFNPLNGSANVGGFMFASGVEQCNFSFEDNSGTMNGGNVYFAYFKGMSTSNLTVARNNMAFDGTTVRGFLVEMQDNCHNVMYENEFLATSTVQNDATALLMFQNATNSLANITRSNLTVRESGNGDQNSHTSGIEYNCRGGGAISIEYVKIDIATTGARSISAFLASSPDSCVVSIRSANFSSLGAGKSASCFRSTELHDMQLSVTRSIFYAEANTTLTEGHVAAGVILWSQNYGDLYRNSLMFEDVVSVAKNSGRSNAIDIDGSLRDVTLVVNNCDLNATTAFYGHGVAIEIEGNSDNDTSITVTNTLTHVLVAQPGSGNYDTLAAFFTMSASKYQSQNLKIDFANNEVHAMGAFALGYQVSSASQTRDPKLVNVSISHVNETFYLTTTGGGNAPVALGFVTKLLVQSTATFDNLTVVIRSTSSTTYCGGIAMVAMLTESFVQCNNLIFDIECGAAAGCFLPIGVSEHTVLDVRNMQCSVKAPHAMGIGTLQAFGTWEEQNSTFELRDSSFLLNGSTCVAGIELPTIGNLKIQNTSISAQDTSTAFGITTAGGNIWAAENNWTLPASTQSAGASILSTSRHSNWNFTKNKISTQTTTTQPQANAATVSVSEEMANFTLDVASNELSTNGVIIDVRLNVSDSWLQARSNSVQQLGDGKSFIHVNSSILDSNVSLVKNTVTSSKGNHTGFLATTKGDNTFLPQPNGNFLVECNFVNSVECTSFPVTLNQLELITCAVASPATKTHSPTLPTPSNSHTSSLHLQTRTISKSKTISSLPLKTVTNTNVLIPTKTVTKFPLVHSSITHTESLLPATTLNATNSTSSTNLTTIPSTTVQSTTIDPSITSSSVTSTNVTFLTSTPVTTNISTTSSSGTADASNATNVTTSTMPSPTSSPSTTAVSTTAPITLQPTSPVGQPSIIPSSSVQSAVLSHVGTNVTIVLPNSYPEIDVSAIAAGAGTPGSIVPPSSYQLHLVMSSSSEPKNRLGLTSLNVSHFVKMVVINSSAIEVRISVIPGLYLETSETITLYLHPSMFLSPQPVSALLVTTIVVIQQPMPPQAAATETAAVVISGTVTSAAAATSISSAVDLQSLSVIGLLSCSGPLERKMLSNTRVLSPLAIDDTFPGMIIGNGILIFGVLLLQVVIAFCVGAATKKGFVSGSLLVRFPSMWMKVLNLTYQGTAIASIRVLQYETDIGPIILAVAGLIVVIVTIPFEMFARKKLVNATFVRYDFFSWKKWGPGIVFFLPFGKWAEDDVKKRLSTLFASLRRSETLWAGVTLFSPSLLILAATFRPPNADGCKVMYWCMGSLQFLLALMFFAFRPYRVTFQSILAGMSNVCLGLILVGSGMKMDEGPLGPGHYLVMHVLQVSLGIGAARTCVSCFFMLAEKRLFDKCPTKTHFVLGSPDSKSVDSQELSDVPLLGSVSIRTDQEDAMVDPTTDVLQELPNESCPLDRMKAFNPPQLRLPDQDDDPFKDDDDPFAAL